MLRTRLCVMKIAERQHCECTFTLIRIYLPGRLVISAVELVSKPLCSHILDNSEVQNSMNHFLMQSGMNYLFPDSKRS